MPDERTILAIGRLERALSRIEAAVAALPAEPAQPSSVEAALERRHEALRARTRQALTALDSVLDSVRGARA